MRPAKPNGLTFLFQGYWLAGYNFYSATYIRDYKGDQILHVQKWKPNFMPDRADITTLPVWVRFLVLPLEYYSSRWLHQVSSQIDKVFKVDEITLRISRGNYASVCVEVDLKKPLKAGYRVNGELCKLQYEVSHVVCFHCGNYSHRTTNCPANN